MQAVLDKVKADSLDQLYPILKLHCKSKKDELFTLDL